jgi:hypothetical protein
MSDNPRHSSRRRRPIEVEPLESRALMSAGLVAPPPVRYLVMTPSSEIVNQQSSSFTVTLTLARVRILTGAFVTDALDQPVTVDFSASVPQTSTTAPASTPAASPFFAPFDESVTFPAGATTETVTVPIISSAVTPGPVIISLSATQPPPSSAASPVVNSSSLSVGLYGSPDAAPPTITGVQLVTHGKRASAVVLDFSKPMAPATVESIRNYQIVSRPITTDHGSFLFGIFGGGVFGSETTESRSFAIAAAIYDPSTLTVTLTLKRPAKASSLYEVSSAYRLKGRKLTDLEGQPLGQYGRSGDGSFGVPVRPILEGYTSPVGQLKTTTDFNQLTF